MIISRGIKGKAATLPCVVSWELPHNHSVMISNPHLGKPIAPDTFLKQFFIHDFPPRALVLFVVVKTKALRLEAVNLARNSLRWQRSLVYSQVSKNVLETLPAFDICILHKTWESEKDNSNHKRNIRKPLYRVWIGLSFCSSPCFTLFIFFVGGPAEIAFHLWIYVCLYMVLKSCVQNSYQGSVTIDAS